jgi:probable HAF family extracellular repeat protein
MYRPNTSEGSAVRAGSGLARRAARMTGLARAGVAALATGSVAGALFLASPALAATGHQAATAGRQAAAATKYSFSTLNDQNDPTFNQLLGINTHNVISGYFGSGAAGHPNKGYLLKPPYGQGNYSNENFPGSAQTQVTGLNNLGDTSGFWVSGNGTNKGFVQWNGVFASFTNPKTPHMAGSVNQLLGVNNNGIAVGFYNDAAGNSHAYQVNQATRVFTAIKIPGAVSTVATGINNAGDIVGFSTDSAGTTTSWLRHNGHLTTFQFPGGSDTQAFGVNNTDHIVGSYLDGNGVQHGFVLSSPLGPKSHWQKIDDPNGVGSTVVNGINAAGDLVGFYTDSAGNTDGMLAMVNKVYLQLQAMPSGTATFGTDSSGNLTVTVNAFGLTPGSPHAVRLLDGHDTTLAQFTTLTATGTGQAGATLNSTFTGSIPPGSRLVILNGPNGHRGAPGAEIIAETPNLDNGTPTSPLPLTALEFNSQGTGFGIPAGTASIAYSPSAQTLTVTLNASGVTPGRHAAHIHTGSCQSQGAVLSMLMDFTATSAGQIMNQTRTVTGVTSGIPATGWYLNLHQGTSNNILKNGQPSIFFRPLLCQNI